MKAVPNGSATVYNNGWRQLLFKKNLNCIRFCFRGRDGFAMYFGKSQFGRTSVADFNHFYHHTKN